MREAEGLKGHALESFINDYTKKKCIYSYSHLLEHSNVRNILFRLLAFPNSMSKSLSYLPLATFTIMKSKRKRCLTVYQGNKYYNCKKCQFLIFLKASYK